MTSDDAARAEAMRLAMYSLDIGKDAPEMQVETEAEARLCNEVLGRVRVKQAQQVYESLLTFAAQAAQRENEAIKEKLCAACKQAL